MSKTSTFCFSSTKGRRHAGFYSKEATEETLEALPDLSCVAKRPHTTYPLSFHPSGRFCKKIWGGSCITGHWAKRQNGEPTTVDNPDEADLDAYREVKDDLHAGRIPRPKAEGVSVADAGDEFMASREDRLDAGELTPLSFRSYLEIAKLIAEFFGRNRLVDGSGRLRLLQVPG